MVAYCALALFVAIDIRATPESPLLKWGSVLPTEPVFWFVMSMALLVGFVTAYPMNWWLVSNHLKHGMMTVRASEQPAMGHENMQRNHDGEKVSRASLVWMTLFSFLVFAMGLGLATAFGGGR